MTTRTEEEFRRVENDRDYWRRRAEAVERKYAPLANRAAIAIVCDGVRRVAGGREFWKVSTLWIDDPREGVNAQRHLRLVMRALEANLKEGDNHA
jgi:hypothetical protein